MGRFRLGREHRRRPHFASLFLVLTNGFKRIELRAQLRNVAIALAHLLVKRLHGSGLRRSRGSLCRRWWRHRTGHPLAQPLSGKVHDERPRGVGQDVAVVIQ